MKKNDEKQQHEKDSMQKAAAFEQSKPKCRICGKFTDRKTQPQCFGHGDGGGSGSGEGSGAGEKAGVGDASSVSAVSLDHVDSSLEARIFENIIVNQQIPIDQQQIFNQLIKAAQLVELELKYLEKFNAEVISDLLIKKILVINNDREHGILTIKLQYDPKLLSDVQRAELKKFIDAILDELNEFKKEKGISSDCCVIKKDNEGNILLLQITLSPALYDAFIQRLANKHLLPIQNIEQTENEKVTYPKNANLFNPQALSTRPSPANRKSIEEDEKINGRTLRPKSPLDGLKPKGHH